MNPSTQVISHAQLRPLFIGPLAGLIAGVVNAIVARLLMRGIAILTMGSGSFSWEGTAVTFAFGALVGSLLGLVYRSAFYRTRAHELVKGMLFSFVLLSTLQVLILYVIPEFGGPLGFLASTIMNLLFVLTLVAFTAWLERVWPHHDSWRGVEVILTVLFGLLALGGLTLLIVGVGGRLLDLLK